MLLQDLPVLPIYLAECVREHVRAGYRGWVMPTIQDEMVDQGVFSSVERIFGESVTASSREGMMREVMMIFNC